MFAPMEMLRDLLSGQSQKHPIPPLDGALSPNSRLDTLGTLDLDLTAPDDVGSDGEGGLLVSDQTRLLKIGADGASQTLAEFDMPVSAFTRLADGSLVVALDGEGLRRLDARGQTRDVATKLAGTLLTGITAVAADGNGGVYFTVGSTRHRAADWVRDLMECNRDGLLGHWIPGDEPRPLLDGLAYPNGVLADDGGHLVITESWAHSVTRYPITDDGVGEPHKLIDNIPGYPSRISTAAGGGYWLAVFAMRTLLIELILGDKAFRQDMMRSLDPELWIRPALSSTGLHHEPLQIGGMKRLGITKAWAPPRSYGLVVRIGVGGELIDSLHSRVDGKRHGITAAREIDGRLLIVSRGNGRILVAPLGHHAGHLS